MNVMKTGLSIVGLCVLVAGCTPSQTLNNSFLTKAKPGPVYKGEWGENSKTTFQVLKENPLSVEYCFETQCNKHSATGTPSSFTITFPPAKDFKGASLQLTQLGDEFHAVYKNTGSEELHRTIYRK